MRNPSYLKSSHNSTTQTIACTGSSVGASYPFGSQTYQVRLVAGSACCYSIGDGAQTATTSSPFLSANAIEYVNVNLDDFRKQDGELD